MRVAFALLLVFCASPLTANPIAEVICWPTEQLRDRMTQQYGAERRAVGLREPEQMMEVWADRHGKWTMVMRYASGRSCIVAMGEHWTETQG